MIIFYRLISQKFLANSEAIYIRQLHQLLEQ